MVTQRFGIGAAIGWGFRVFIEHILFFVAISFVWLPLVLIAFFLVLLPCGYLANLIQETVLVSVISLFCTSWLLFGLSLLGTFLELGFVKIQLDLYDTGKSSIRTLFSQGKLLFRGWAAHFLFLLLVGLGLVCFVIPGIYFFCRFYFYRYALVDKKLGVFESFKEAGRLSEGARWALFGFSIINSVLNVLPFALIVTSLAQVYAYKKQGELAKEVVSPPFES